MSYPLEHDTPHESMETEVPLEFSTEEGNLKIIGFWIFLAAEVVLFASLFATYLTLHDMTAGGPSSKELFDFPGFTTETFLLLTSSFTCGLATHSMRRGHRGQMVAMLILTLLLGLGFVGMEIREFVTYVSDGATIQRSAFLSAFFVLVGTHGCHVSMGILWMTLIVVQLMRLGITEITARKVFVWALYWHFLDVVWIFIFTAVYLMGKVT